MLSRKMAEPLLLYVNDPAFMSSFRDVVQYKINILNKDLASASDVLAIGRLQGGIQQLNRLLLLDQEIKAAANE